MARGTLIRQLLPPSEIQFVPSAASKDNVSINNLALITCDVNLELNRKKYRFQNPELTQSGILAAQLAVDIRKRKGTT